MRKGPAQAFFPHFFAGVGFPAHRDPGIEHAVKVAVMDHERRDIESFFVLPGEFGGAVGQDRGHVVRRVPAAGVNMFAVGDGRGDAFGRRAGGFPERFAGQRRVADDLVAADHDDLVDPADAKEDR